jgi:pyrimidine 5'-nucleotidase
MMTIATRATRGTRAGHAVNVAAQARARSSRHRIVAAKSDPVWLFDLDNTLHHASHAIFPRINLAMTDFIETTLGVGRDEANRLRTGYTRHYGAALLGLVRRHNVDASHFLDFVHEFPDLDALVRTERGLKRALQALPGRKLVLTNGPAAYAASVLARLGIAGVFERVIAIEDMKRGSHWRAKPDQSMLRQLLRSAKIRPRQAVLVEDTRSHLKNYRRMGLRTVWLVGHLPVVRGDAPGAVARIAGSGRPHYVDRRVRSIGALARLGPRSGA